MKRTCGQINIGGHHDAYLTPINNYIRILIISEATFHRPYAAAKGGIEEREKEREWERDDDTRGPS